MLAAENAGLPGGKVGGIGDVIRDAPRALAALGHRVTVVTPGYGHFSQLAGARRVATVSTHFRAQPEALHLYQVPPETPVAGVSCLALEHPAFSQGGAGHIYIDDAPDRPFATDANRFALLCAATASALANGAIERPDVVHLHDWHSALFALLLRVDPTYRPIADLPLVYTIHNLALQGIRPLAGDDSSLLAWFPDMTPVPDYAIDPRYRDCLNPVRAAITLCDRIHAVSPNYASEICSAASDFGCGLQPDLSAAGDAGRLSGILNGCDYAAAAVPAPDFRQFLELARRNVLRWIARSRQVQGAHVLALHRLERLLVNARRPRVLLTSVGRLTDQKIGLLCARMPDGRLCLDHALDELGNDGLCIMLGSGDPELELAIAGVAAERDNLLFLCGYSDDLSDLLYRGGDLFLMPSTFEPCGISQMLAMRAGQPCLVNAVGGLADTVDDGVTGFVFGACSQTSAEQALLGRLQQALYCLHRQPEKYAQLREAAAAVRFPWEHAAKAYVERLYRVA